MKLKFYLALFLVLLLLATGCDDEKEISDGTNTEKCGNGVCDPVELSRNVCPEDCAENVPPIIVDDNNNQSTINTEPVYFAVMTHMEHGFNDDNNENFFNKHVDEINWAMDIFDEYDAKLTLESEQPFAIAAAKYDSNIMMEVLERGHGVGTHCDIGKEEMSTNAYNQEFIDNKELVDALVGPENNLGCSGGFGPNDYIEGALNAGFKYLDGIVYMAWLAVPQENRPGRVSDDEVLADFHESFLPVEEAMYPIRISSLDDSFVDNSEGKLVLMTGSVGEIATMYEGRSCSPDCALTKEDADALLAIVNEAVAAHDQSRLAHIYIHIPANEYVAENEEVFRYFLSEMQKLQDEGKIQWVTQREAYELIAFQ